jgi:hypothetical protein
MQILIRSGIVAGALTTAYVHSTLGGSPIFVANTVGYAVLALAMIVPLSIVARRRWLVRAALLGFTAFTIFGWFMFGARYWLAYVDKAVELGIIALVVVEMLRYDGGPANVLRRLIDGSLALVRRPFGQRGQA